MTVDDAFNINVYFSLCRRSYLEKRKFVFAFHCNLTIKGTYDAKGRIILFNIDGGGDAKIKLSKYRLIKALVKLLQQFLFFMLSFARYIFLVNLLKINPS